MSVWCGYVLHYSYLLNTTIPVEEPDSQFTDPQFLQQRASRDIKLRLYFGPIFPTGRFKSREGRKETFS